jgi:hypothetical protein
MTLKIFILGKPQLTHLLNSDNSMSFTALLGEAGDLSAHIKIYIGCMALDAQNVS